jgi:hypothetical protein
MICIPKLFFRCFLLINYLLFPYGVDSHFINHFFINSITSHIRLQMFDCTFPGELPYNKQILVRVIFLVWKLFYWFIRKFMFTSNHLLVKDVLTIFIGKINLKIPEKIFSGLVWWAKWGTWSLPDHNFLCFLFIDNKFICFLAQTSLRRLSIKFKWIINWLTFAHSLLIRLQLKYSFLKFYDLFH